MSKHARYIDVKNYLIKGIREHVWSEGDKIPSENTLCETCDVSRMTARRAVKELTHQGILYSLQGKGTFISKAKSRSSVMTIRNIADEVIERGHRYHCLVLNLEQLNNPSCIPLLSEQELFSDLEYIYYSRIIHFENDLPIQLEERFINPILAGDYLKQDFQLFTPNEYLMKICPINEAEHKIEAVLPTPQQSQWLEISPSQPCLKISRTTYSDDNIASFAILYHPGNRFQLGNHLKLQKGN